MNEVYWLASDVYKRLQGDAIYRMNIVCSHEDEILVALQLRNSMEAAHLTSHLAECSSCALLAQELTCFVQQWGKIVSQSERCCHFEHQIACAALSEAHPISERSKLKGS
jgi:hypothetical protein